MYTTRSRFHMHYLGERKICLTITALLTHIMMALWIMLQLKLYPLYPLFLVTQTTLALWTMQQLRPYPRKVEIVVGRRQKNSQRLQIPLSRIWQKRRSMTGTIDQIYIAGSEWMAYWNDLSRDCQRDCRFGVYQGHLTFISFVLLPC
jgi:hypothetical protein